jgi:cathepsin F
MLFAAFIVTFICLLAVARAGNLYFDDEVLMKDMWATFKKDWRKEYASPEEENKRYGIFLENLKLADQRNWEERLEGGDATHGVTKFMDIHVDDFKARFRNADSSLRSTEDAIEATITAEPVEDAKVVDWSGKYTTAVKDQGECGSCWAFSVTEQIESDMIRQHGKRHVLSPQQLVDCDQHGGGCKGGFTDQGYRYVRTVGGMVKNTDYPYDSGKDGKSGTCDLDIDEAVVTVKDYFTLADEKKMSSYMQSTGPISVCIDAAKWQTYNGGVLRSCGK